MILGLLAIVITCFVLFFVSLAIASISGKVIGVAKHVKMLSLPTQHKPMNQQPAKTVEKKQNSLAEYNEKMLKKQKEDQEIHTTQYDENYF